jgi:polyribonucleotide nucleotidyltransferase
MFHYNFPPYSVGETRFIGSPKRRDIGHGALAERAITPVLPGPDDFPYTVRLVSEVLSSNGSTSMASTCAGILALMDAGVPIKAPVAGISIGLITGDDGQFATLTDIQGMEDHFGDMDFKVAGTAEGITAIQLDIKIDHIGFDIIEAALAQAKEARLTILDAMRQAIDGPREDMSPYAPRMTRISIPVDKIGAVIGPGGKIIRGIIEETGATVDVEDDGTITIGSTDESAARRAIVLIEGLTKEAKVGDIYTGKVVRIMNFGAFVNILPQKDGMVHISELADHHVSSVEDVVKLGDEITVIVKDIDASGRIALSRRALLQGDQGSSQGDGGGPGGDPRPGGDGRPGPSSPGQRPQGGGWRGGQRGGPRPGSRPSRSGPPR